MKKLLLLLVLTAGCVPFHYNRTALDGTATKVDASFPFWSNTALKGLKIDNVTKTTSTGFGVSTATVEPNVESITATSDALGNLIGTAAKAAAK